MLLNLSDVLGEHHKTIEREVEIEMEQVLHEGSAYPILSKEPFYIRVEHVEGRTLVISGKTEIRMEIPCDRCLEAVETGLKLDFKKKVDLSVSDGEQPDELDETNYIDGYELDTEQLLCNEILIGWPTKILCSNDCKGICSVCGQNLNRGACDCEDTSLDPRMSVIRDLFKNFKEV